MSGDMFAHGQALSTSEARDYYDRFGSKQDSQGFYEDPALDILIAHSDFHQAENIFEFGCGTGRLAARLLADHCAPSAMYVGCDISPVMIGHARRRLETYGKRARVVLSDGVVRFPIVDHSVDRIVSSYVLDLLAEADILKVFDEARRTLAPQGRLCLVSLSKKGINIRSAVISRLWAAAFKLRPVLVGGCRPINLDLFVNTQQWRFIHRQVVAPYGVPSEVLVLETMA